MRVISHLVFIITLLLNCQTNWEINLPRAQKGILDFKKLNFDLDSVHSESIPLDGEWEFYWDEYIDPGSICDNLNASECSNQKYIEVPGHWQNFKYPINGFGTYRLKIQLLKPTSELVLLLNPISSSYKIFINKNFVYESEKLGKTREDTIPLIKRKIIPIPNQVTELEILIQVANFYHIRSGILNSIVLGKKEKIESKDKSKIASDLILASSLFMIGFYHFVLFLNRRKDKAPLYFGIFSMIMGIRTIIINDRWILDEFSFLSFALILKLEIISTNYGTFSFFQFVKSFFAKETSNWLIRISGITLIPACVIVILTAMNVYLKTIYITLPIILLGIIYTFVISIHAIKNKRPGSLLFFIGFVFYSITIFVGILKTMGFLFLPFIGSYGLFIFTIFQVIILSRRFGREFEKAESLSEELKEKSIRLEKTANELKELTTNLESMVQERTSDLQIAKEEIEYLNQFSKIINSTNNLDTVFQYAVKNLKEKFDTNVFLLQLLNKEKMELVYRCAYFPSEIPEELVNDYYSLRLPVADGVGSYFVTISRKKTLYLKDLTRISSEDFSPFDTRLNNDLKLTSVLQVPLLLQKEVIGIIHINKYGGMKALSKSDIHFIESLCEQLALAVNNSALFEETEIERQKSEKLLLNILPREVALELKEKGFAEPVFFESVSVMFTDFKGFTQIAEKLSPKELVKDLDACFVQFDKISERYNLEKLKTIGDSYMCAGGIPKKNKTHAVDCCLAALEIQNFMNLMKQLKEEQGFPYWELRLGIHTGSLVAGVIGERKFAYDVWGDTVNTASRMESSGTPGRINISYTTYELIKEFFECEYRGEVNAKNKGVVKMYYLNRLKPDFSKDKEGLIPNGKFWEKI
jgi:class 3 adenylate cyclase